MGRVSSPDIPRPKLAIEQFITSAGGGNVTVVDRIEDLETRISRKLEAMESQRSEMKARFISLERKPIKKKMEDGEAWIVQQAGMFLLDPSKLVNAYEVFDLDNGSYEYTRVEIVKSNGDIEVVETGTPIESIIMKLREYDDYVLQYEERKAAIQKASANGSRAFGNPL